MTKGIELLKTLPESDERMKWELDILISMGPPLIATKGWASPEAEKAYSRARELCDQIGTDSQRFPVLRGLWNFYNVQADYQTSTELSEKLMYIGVYA